jgi:cysteine-rich repeat protein
LLLATLVLAAAPFAGAWNVSCLDEAGEECPDGYAKVRTPWRPHPQSEHRRLFERTLEIGGLPASLRETFQLTVHADDATLSGEDGRSYKSIRPVRNGARHIVLRELSVQAMSNLPDNSYTLWDWASGNEICPPDRGNADALDCHNYETHIGWLNANHMLPQSQRFYEHLHRLALDRAKECKGIHDELLPAERVRFEPLLLACEKEALILEAVGHHYLQDSWSMGHMWERWGGVEIGDFRGSRPLGFAIAAFTGTIHGAGAMIPFGVADDPMCAPHDDENYVDDPDAEPREHPGVGDVYLESFLFDADGAWAPQRRALFGCAVDGVRAVYAETAQVHGPMQAADATEIDGSRHVTDPTCWRQRATNEAIATGCGIHLGVYPFQTQALSGITTAPMIAGILPLALSSVLAETLAGVETLPIDDAARFAADAAYACTLAAAHAAIPGIAGQTNLAEGGLPSLVGVEPNSAYARGNAFSTPIVPPSSYADPALPWELDAASDRDEKEALNLAFADAHAADRCRTFTVADLNVYRSQVELAQTEGDPEVLEARCSQCAQLVAPHLRFGVEGNHDPQREAFCAFVALGTPAFVYTDDDPATFPGADDSLEASRTAAQTWCGCSPVSGTPSVTVNERNATIHAEAFAIGASPPIVEDDRVAPSDFTTFTETGTAQRSGFETTAEALVSQNANLAINATGALIGITSQSETTATGAGINADARGESNFGIGFEVTSGSVAYVLSGSIAAAFAGPEQEGEAGVAFSFEGPGVQIRGLVGGFTTGGTPEGPPSQTLGSTGILGPGRYLIGAGLQTQAQAHDRSESQTASWDFTLTLSPAIGTTSTSTSSSTTTTTSTSTLPSSSTTISSTTSSTTATTLFGLPVIPYARYAATGPDGPVVTLVDEFITETVDLGAVMLELPPVTIDGQLPFDPLTHQTCHAHPGGTLDACIDVQDRFGAAALRLGNPVGVCTRERFTAIAVDNFKCYAANGSALETDVVLEDAFQSQTVTVGAPELLCTPVAVDGESLVEPLRYLVCYATTPLGAAGGPIEVDNALHPDPIAVDVGVATGLCVPAVRQLPATCLLCGNGVVDGAEDCDDGGVLAGDGCSAVCRFELDCTCDGLPLPPPNDERCGTLADCGGFCTGCAAGGGVCGCQ